MLYRFDFLFGTFLQFDANAMLSRTEINSSIDTDSYLFIEVWCCFLWVGTVTAVLCKNSSNKLF
jgi:hypothetical protein